MYDLLSCWYFTCTLNLFLLVTILCLDGRLFHILIPWSTTEFVEIFNNKKHIYEH